ncbi:pyruvate kinase [candidate division WWE3 bacterium CG_4_9_14_3_um_filter_34_6]|uniref:Pyruvate kinase n=1 Tax=candidate division WWE3 bacterium CG_4_9_14_3_um_filter_34_6 TaxID=1975079 RepID=A0A2M7X4F8_UNCKA|nr:MAG: pyruvate kinase [candidate division WWE3 bacterium CG_4_9_14_3_um_filter_34_6]
MSQKTKIIATLGPASESNEMIEKLILSGVNIFRFNLKHNTHEWHENLMNRVKNIAKNLNKKVAIFADMQGPELRTGIFPNNVKNISLLEGENILLSAKFDEKANATWIPFKDVKSVKDLSKGTMIYIDDGKIELEVTKFSDTNIFAVVKGGGVLGTQKSISIPNAKINVPTLMPKDISDAKFSIKQKVDFIALSFVRDSADIATLRKLIVKEGGNQSIVAKIETLKAIENIDEIINETDVIMVARGDLGVEIPIERVPRIQKQLIYKCRLQAKPVIVATQMLLSMVNNITPSRAEVADIANAVFDKTDCLMLSEETATGANPDKVASTMSKIARYNEMHEFTDDLSYTPKSFEEIVIGASIKFSRKAPSGESEVKGYIVFTESGKSVRVLSRFRPPLPIYAFSTHFHVAKQMIISYGTIPYQMKLHKNPVTNTKNALEILQKDRYIETGDRLIVIFGNNVGVPEANNTISIIKA